MPTEWIVPLRYFVLVGYVFGGGYEVYRAFAGRNLGMVRSRPSSFAVPFGLAWFLGLFAVSAIVMPR